MMYSSPGSPEALVRLGRARRRVPTLLRRAAALTAAALLTGLVVAPAAVAHEGADRDVGAVLDTITDMPGVTMTIETTPLGSQFLLENPTPTEVTILSSVGDPLFRVGPEGVLGNIRSPEWYTSKVPDGAISIPERAAEKGVPVWLKVSQEPSWGWFDHRLHAVSVPVDQKKTTAPLTRLGSWTVPLQYGATLGSADGHFEYRPVLGSFIPELADSTPAAGVTLKALPGNPRPGISITNSGSSEVIVLGDAGEPYLRVTPAGVDANGASPTWVASQKNAAATTFVGDASAPPQWVRVAGSPTYAFTLERGEPGLGRAELYALGSPAVVREWQVELLVDGRPVTVDGTTVFTPAGYEPSYWPLLAGIAGAVLVLAAVVLLVRRRPARTTATTRAAPKPSGKKDRAALVN